MLWGAFVTDWARQGNLANAERRAPLVFGLGAVNVFNEWDLKIMRNHAAPVQPADLETRLTFTPNEALDRQLSQRLWANAPLAIFCDPGYARMWFRGFSDSLPASDPARRRTFSMQFSSWTHPTNEELRTFRPVPITWETRCIVHIDPQRRTRHHGFRRNGRPAAGLVRAAVRHRFVTSHAPVSSGAARRVTIDDAPGAH